VRLYSSFIDGHKKDKCGETTVAGKTLDMYKTQKNDKKMIMICLPLRSTKVINIKLPLSKSLLFFFLSPNKFIIDNCSVKSLHFRQNCPYQVQNILLFTIPSAAVKW